MKLYSLLLVLFSAIPISSARAAPEAVAGGERSTFTPGSEVVFDLESNRSPRPGSGEAIRALPPVQGSLHQDAIDGRLVAGTVRTAADLAPEPDFLLLAR